MSTSSTLFCPITKAYCKQCEYAFWCGYAGECAVPLLTGILADSTINLRYFPPYEEG